MVPEMIIILILSSTSIGFLFAVLQAKPVKKMIDYGASPWHNFVFHAISISERIVYGGVVFLFTKSIRDSVVAFLVASEFFDGFLNLYEGHNWDFVGRSAGMDKIISKLGKNAGKIKTIATIVAVAALLIFVKK